ncbi:acyl carrier protein [Streptomyces griseochromogenes]|uniref:Acyl carrier protein n=1 Tax=Streptomyces griseochromogenes TaxID=68214 RepID=A0A1B1BBA8_9ACTN|nr:phosphopantetheine-binding protein [Streptomyces griseochromogenes]ANP56012.1 hypothetical protein AVL59_46115 [Streptomyces griseochromogenes]MBP2051139.1 acyl carrier protein [Streptomyces griseochromogenes]
MLDTEFEKILLTVLRTSASETPLGPDSDLRAAGLSSIGTIDLLMRLEERYGVKFPDSALNGRTFATPRALWDVLETYRAKA